MLYIFYNFKINYRRTFLKGKFPKSCLEQPFLKVAIQYLHVSTYDDDNTFYLIVIHLILLLQASFHYNF